MKHTHPAWLAALMIAGSMAAAPLPAQDAPPAAPDAPSSTASAKPKPVIYKAGEKVQVKWGSSWWDATIVSNLGGGQYRIKWAKGNWKEEVKSAADIRRPDQEDDAPSDRSSRARASSSFPESAAPAADDKSSGFKVGDSITWKSGEKTLTGTVTTLVNATMLKAVVEGEEEEKIVLVKNITTPPTAAKDAAAAPRKPAASNKTGFYVKGQEIEYTFVGSTTKPGTVIRDRGAKVLYLDGTFKSIKEIERSQIVTPPQLEKADPAFARMITDKSLDLGDTHPSGRSSMQKAESTRYLPGPASLDTQPPNPRIKIENPKPSGTGNRPADRFFVGPVNPVAFVTFKADNTTPGHMIQYDLTTGKPVRTLKFPESAQVVDVSPNGSRAVTLAKGKLTLWSLEEKEPVKTLSFEAFGPGSDFDPDSDTVYLIGDSFVFISSADGADTSVWRVGENTLTCVWNSGQDREPAFYFTPQRTAVLARNWSSLTILDSMSGKNILKVSTPFVGAAAFSTDGKRLALYSSHSRELTIHNVSDRQIEKTIALPSDAVPGGEKNPGLQWVGPASLLIAEKYLVDLKSGAVVWQFTDIVPFKCTGTGIAWALIDDPKGGQALASTYLLDANVTNAIDNAKLEKVAILKEGDSIALNVNVDGGPPGIGDRARQGLEKYFQEKKITINPNAPIKLNLTGTADPAKELLVRESFTNETKVSFRTSTYRLEVVKNGKTVWSTGGGYRGPGGVVVRQQNESYQQAVDRGIKEAYRWLESPSIPIPLLKSLKDSPPASSPLFP